MLEALGLVCGLLAVVLLIRQSIWTWPIGILYVLLSLFIFIDARLYADLLLHVVYLFLNAYGWYYWSRGKSSGDDKLPVTKTPVRIMGFLLLLASAGIALLGLLLTTYTDAALPYWDSTTTILSFAGMWLTARKKIENWYIWFVVDVIAAGMYFYKELYFFSILYFIYIGLAVAGYISWRKTYNNQQVHD